MSRRARVALALLISLLLHGVILLVDEPEAPPREAIELEIVELDSADIPPQPAPEPEPKAAPHREGGTGKPRRPGAVRPPAAEATPPPPAPREEARRLILEPRWSEVLPPPPPPEPPAEPPSEARRIEERLEGFFADDKARQTARTQADPYWHQLRKRFERGFSPTDEILSTGPGGGLAPGLPAAVDGWRKQAQAFAATGNPYGEGPDVPGARGTMAQEERDKLLPAPLWGGAPEQPGSMHTTFKHRLVTEVRLRQEAGGRPAEVAVHRSSGSPAFDRMAVETVREMARDPGPTPAQGRTSIWEFDGTLIITPPMPIAGCALDAAFIPQECFYPLSRRVRRAVRLLAIYPD